MNAGAHRRKGIVSLPVAIFFVALVAAAAVSAGMIASGQSALANKQLGAEGILAGRQAQLSGLSATSSGSGMLQLTQRSGVATAINYALIETSGGQTTVEPVDYVINPGNTISVNLTSMAQSVFGKNLPSIASITLVTGQGVYITSQVQTVQQSKQVTTYQQQQVQKTGQQLVGYDVSMTSAAYYSCNGVVSSSSLCYTSYSATQHTQYSCPSWETLIQQQNGDWVCQGTGIGYYSPTATTTPGSYTCPSGWSLSGSTCSQQQTYYTWVPGYYTYQQVNYHVPGYWSQYYVPGYRATYQYWVPGYWTSYTYSYTTTQTVWWGYYCAYFGLGCWSMPICHFGAIWCWPVTQVVVHYVTVEVWHPGYWATGQYWVSGYWASYYVPGHWVQNTYTTRQWVSTGGYWTIQWRWDCNPNPDTPWCLYIPMFVWVSTGYWQTVTQTYWDWVPGYWSQYYVPGHWQTYQYWVPGYWATGQYWVSGYYTTQTYQVWVPGYWQTQTYQVWVPGYWQTNTKTVTTPATWNPPVTTYSCPSGWTLTTTILGPDTCESTTTYVSTPLVYYTYSCNSGDTLSGTTCKHSYPAVYYPAVTKSLGQMSYCPTPSFSTAYSCTAVYQTYTYTVTETVPVTKTVYYTVLSTSGSSWSIGG